MNSNLKQAQKLNIGYLLPDANDAEVAFIRWRSLVQHDEKALQIFWYINGADYSMAKLPGKRRNIQQMTAEAAVRMIRLDQISILVDLSGYKNKKLNDILASKPAKLQATFVGRFNTTNLYTMDYLFTDKYCDNINEKQVVQTEKLFYLLGGHYCYVPDKLVRNEDIELPFQRNKYVLFACLHEYERMENSFLAVWSKILQAVPQSRLLLKSRIFGGGYICEETKYRLNKLGLPVERVEFVSPKIADEIIYQEVDIILDTYPWQGGTNTCEALYNGVPVITMAGKYRSVRLGYSLLRPLGLMECLANSSDDYIKKAVSLANNHYKLLRLRKDLPQRMQKAALMDGKRYIASLENAYRAIWSAYVEKRKFKPANDKIAGLINSVKDGFKYIEAQLQVLPNDEIIAAVLADIELAFHNISLSIIHFKTASFYQQELQVVIKDLHSLKKYSVEKEWLKCLLLIKRELEPKTNALAEFLLKEVADNGK